MEIWKKGKENVLVISEGELEDLIGLGADRIAEKKGLGDTEEAMQVMRIAAEIALAISDHINGRKRFPEWMIKEMRQIRKLREKSKERQNGRK